MLKSYENKRKDFEEHIEISNLSDKAKEKHFNVAYKNLNQYLSEIRLCILGLQEIFSYNIPPNAIKLLETLDKKSDDILNHVFADDEKTIFDIYDLLKECQLIYLKEATQNLIKIDIDQTTSLSLYYGDQLKIKQIVLSLIGKCFKSVPEGGHIQIKTKNFVVEENIFIEITITDNGFSEETILHMEKNLRIDKNFQIIDLMILNFEKVNDVIQEEGGILDILPHPKGRKYKLTLGTTYLNFPNSNKKSNNIIRLNIYHDK